MKNNNLTINNPFILDDGNDVREFFDMNQVELVKGDGVHQYIWGGCFFNRQTQVIDKIYHKRINKMFDVYYAEHGRDTLRVYLINEQGKQASPGLIRKDWTGYTEEIKGGSFYLQGICESMGKVNVAPALTTDGEWFI